MTINDGVYRYDAINADIGEIKSIDMASNNRKTRPTISLSVNHNLDKAQRVGFSVSYRKEAFNSGSSTSAMVQYSKGFQPVVSNETTTRPSAPCGGHG
jgi:hypothetical protein